MKIFVLLKFALSSASSYLVDLGVYALLLYLIGDMLPVGGQVLVCTAISRVVSSLFNYILNRKTVFKSKESVPKTIFKYGIVTCLKLAASYALVYFFTYILEVEGFLQLLVKALVDLGLFVLSFIFQKSWVFKNKKA